MKRYSLGLDFGGGGGRALLLDLDSGETTSVARHWRFHVAPETGGLGCDVDLDLTWTTFGDLTQQVLRRAGADAESVVGIAATAMRLGSVFVDEDGAPLLAVPNRDARAAGPGIMMAIHHGAEIQKVMGRWPYPIYTAARLQWLAENRPDIIERADSVLSLSDWIAMRLCGERATDPSQAAETLLFELEARRWSEHWISELGIDASVFPPMLESGTKLGELRPDAAKALGLRPGTPVAVGGADTQCALLGAGAVQPGDAGVVAGTTAPVQRFLDQPLIDPEARIWSSQHLVRGRWLVESNPGPLGESLEWMSAVMHPDVADPVPRFLDSASRFEAGAAGLLSCLGAGVMNDRAMGLPAGHLTLSHLVTGRHPRPGEAVARAVVEGMACGLRANLEQVEALAGPSREAFFFLAGGLARSRFFAELLAGVIGRPVRRSTESSTSAIGAALCAAVAVGAFDDLDDAAASRAVHCEIVEPDESESEALGLLYQRWSRWRAASSDIDAITSELTMPFALAGQQAASIDDAG